MQYLHDNIILVAVFPKHLSKKIPRFKYAINYNLTLADPKIYIILMKLIRLTTTFDTMLVDSNLQ